MFRYNNNANITLLNKFRKIKKFVVSKTTNEVKNELQMNTIVIM